MAKINKRVRAGQIRRAKKRAMKVKKLKVAYEKGGDKKAILKKVAKLANHRLTEFK